MLGCGAGDNRDNPLVNYGKSPFWMGKSTISMATNYGKSPCFMGKSTISMAMFNSKLSVSLPEGSLGNLGTKSCSND